jgi:hypothetical protein
VKIENRGPAVEVPAGGDDHREFIAFPENGVVEVPDKRGAEIIAQQPRRFFKVEDKAAEKAKPAAPAPAPEKDK